MADEMYEDRVFHSFLEVQREAGSALAVESDLLDLVPLPNPGRCVPVKYIARFHCKGLVQDPETRGSRNTTGSTWDSGFLRITSATWILFALPPSSIPGRRGTRTSTGHTFAWVG